MYKSEYLPMPNVAQNGEIKDGSFIGDCAIKYDLDLI